jgi:hypothetical protein
VRCHTARAPTASAAEGANDEQAADREKCERGVSGSSGSALGPAGDRALATGPPRPQPRRAVQQQTPTTGDGEHDEDHPDEKRVDAELVCDACRDAADHPTVTRPPWYLPPGLLGVGGVELGHHPMMLDAWLGRIRVEP